MTHTVLRTITIGLIFLFQFGNSNAQNFTNRNFSNGTSGWGCNPEVNPRSTYGGTGTNAVAEIDSEAGLCQTVTGFTVGAVYELSIDASRRTTSGCTPPATARIFITASNGALNAQLVRTNTSFSMTESTFTFTATSTSHTFNFAADFSGTCGVIVDNLSISLVSGLPVELKYFNAQNQGNAVTLDWVTASERNNDRFVIERSADAQHWEEIGTVAGALNSVEERSYNFKDNLPLSGFSYYRLMQVDTDGTTTYSDIRTIERKPGTSFPSPNPATGTIFLTGAEAHRAVWHTLTGSRVSPDFTETKEGTTWDLSPLKNGTYILTVITDGETVTQYRIEKL